VGGSLAGSAGGVSECVEGARVTLKKDGRQIAQTLSDPYGEFKFSGLEEGSGAYRVEVAAERYAAKAVDFDLKSSTYLGTISLAAGGIG
jgi:hypothetical protein